VLQASTSVIRCVEGTGGRVRGGQGERQRDLGMPDNVGPRLIHVVEPVKAMHVTRRFDAAKINSVHGVCAVPSRFAMASLLLTGSFSYICLIFFGLDIISSIMMLTNSKRDAAVSWSSFKSICPG
jgi:hypothetical protein